MQPTISVYTSAFNVVKNQFNIFEYIRHVVNLADEVVISVNKSEDNTLEIFKDYATDFPIIKIIESDFSYTDPLLDGKCKNNALQHTTGDIKIQLDLDEYVNIDNVEAWKRIAYALFTHPNFDAVMIPVLNIYKDLEHVKSIGQKWYMHKPGLFRGPVNFGKLDNGHVDVNKSDTTELIDKDGNLVKTVYLLDPNLQIDGKTHLIKELSLPYVIHTGYLDLQDRITRNKNFWKEHWSLEAGKDVYIPLTTEELDKDIYFEHKLNVD